MKIVLATLLVLGIISGELQRIVRQVTADGKIQVLYMLSFQCRRVERTLLD